jgi:GTP cyclohydrolase IA
MTDRHDHTPEPQTPTSEDPSSEDPSSEVQTQQLERLSQLTESWLEAIGEDPTREGLLATPKRVAKAWTFLTQGYGQDLKTIVNEAVFEAEDSGMVIIKDITFYSMCEHHLLPFFGRAHIGYIPNQKILGLSKFARIVDLFARRLQVQERLTKQVANAIMDTLEPQGVGVILEGVHLCMAMRGVEQQASSTMTTSTLGVFADPSVHAAFLGSVTGRSIAR